MGHGWESVIHPDDLNNCLVRWANSVRTGSDYEVEYRFKRASDGAYRWHLGRANALKIDGKVARWFGYCTDIHEQKMTLFRLQNPELVGMADKMGVQL